MSAPRTIGDMGEPTAPKPGLRRSGGLQAHALADGLAERLVQAHGPINAVREAFELGQRFGHGRLGDLRGCPGCGAKSVALVAGELVCLLLLCGRGGAR